MEDLILGCLVLQADVAVLLLLLLLLDLAQRAAEGPGLCSFFPFVIGIQDSEVTMKTD